MKSSTDIKCIDRDPIMILFVLSVYYGISMLNTGFDNIISLLIATKNCYHALCIELASEKFV